MYPMLRMASSPTTVSPAGVDVSSFANFSSYATLDDLVPEEGVVILDLVDFYKLETTDLATTKIKNLIEYTSPSAVADPLSQYSYIILELDLPRRPIFVRLQRRRFDNPATQMDEWTHGIPLRYGAIETLCYRN